MASWAIEYYETATGRVPVLEWIEAMLPEERALALLHIDQLALLGLEAHAPLVKSLGGKLYELRWSAGRKQHRVIYVATIGRTFLLLHGFVKKTQSTPRHELQLASSRWQDYQRRHPE